MLTADTEIDVSPDDIVRPKQLAAAYPDKLKEGQIDWQIRNRDQNGLAKSGALVFVSNRWYVIRPLYWRWFMSQGAA